jgi:DinB superfamily
VAKIYRRGAVGAMMDEYERAVADLPPLIRGLSDEAFELVRDRETKDEDCRSIQSIMHHVVRAGYGYAVDIRNSTGTPAERPDLPLGRRLESLDQLAAMMAYNVDTLEGKWELTYEEIMAVKIHAPWGPMYDLEQWLEHAIVHVLRHRRQIERFLAAAAA